jgi:hypothetical protein
VRDASCDKYISDRNLQNLIADTDAGGSADGVADSFGWFVETHQFPCQLTMPPADPEQRAGSVAFRSGLFSATFRSSSCYTLGRTQNVLSVLAAGKRGGAEYARLWTEGGSFYLDQISGR